MDFLNNTDIVVTIAFVIFIGILLYVGVPKIVGKLLDDRADKIRAEIDEARQLREEAQSLLASYERKQKDVEVQARKIVDSARDEAQAAAVQAREDLAATVERRLKAAEDQIASAEGAVLGEVKSKAVAVAVAAAREVITKDLKAAQAGSLIDEAIADVGERLH